MKKILFMCAIFLISGQAYAEACANGSGTVIEAKDGRHYCKSNITMNWWSAFAWCDAIGGTLVDLTSDCIPNKPVTTDAVACPNLKTGTGGWCWTQSVPSSTYAYLVSTSSGEVLYNYRNYSYSALCAGF